MMRVHRTWARGASAIAVPGWPLLAACGASMARPRMTLMARCSRSGSAVMRRPPYWPRRVDRPLAHVERRTGRRSRSGHVQSRRWTVLEQHDAGGETMDEAAAADRSELAGARHAGDGVDADRVAHRAGVVVGLAEEPRAPAVAGEEEGGVAGDRGQQLVKVLVRRLGVAHVELHGRAHLDRLAHHQGPGGPVGAHQRAHEEVAPPERGAVLVAGDADVQARA